MTVALAGRAPATFEIKSANLPLVALLLKSHDLGAIANELQVRFGDLPSFFDNDPLVIDLSALQAQMGATLDFAALLALLRGYRVMPVAARGGSAAQMEAALQAGLAAAEDATVGGQPRKQAGQEQPDPAEWVAVRTEGQNDEPVQVSASSATQAGGQTPSSLAISPGALVVDKPLRSGQQVYARGRDLVVLSMVNPGAEVIADGHIHVWAPLRGKAIAGARGNTEARIMALSLEPELISIAGVYRTSDVPLAPDVLGRPTQVRLVGGPEGKLVMEPLVSPPPARKRG